MTVHVVDSCSYRRKKKSQLILIGSDCIVNLSQLSLFYCNGTLSSTANIGASNRICG